MYRSISFAFVIISCVVSGCANEPAAPANGIGAVAAPKEQEAEEGGIADKMANLVKKAKANTPSYDDVKKIINDAGDATGQTADDTMNWVNEMYKSLSDRGLTTAKSAGDWVSEDWNAINAWEYKVVNVESKQIADNPEVLSETLNESGKHRWECFHVSDGTSGTTFFMKRQKKSYLKNIPLKDMMKLIPLLDNDDG